MLVLEHRHGSKELAPEDAVRRADIEPALGQDPLRDLHRIVRRALLQELLVDGLLSGLISEGRASNFEEDAEAMHQMGYEMGQQDITNPTRQQTAEAHGLEWDDERLDKMGFALYPTSRQRLIA